MTTVQKSIRGTWEACDTIELGADQVLKISTHKVSGGALVTTATVSTRDGGFLSHMMFQDFSKRLATTAARCTEKTVAAQHAACMTGIDEVRSAITAWYVSKEGVTA